VIAPGPRGLLLTGNLFALRRDVLGMLLDGRRRYGDVVRFRMGPRVYHLAAHPDHVRHVLVAHPERYDKATPSSARIRGITGESLLTADGPTWKRRRGLIQPAFQQQQIADYHDGIVAATGELLLRWRTVAAAGRPVDVASEMMRLTFAIVARALFGADVSGDVEEVERAAGVVMAHTYRRLEQFAPLPLWFPTPGNFRFRRELVILDRLVERIIAERRVDVATNDIVSRLIKFGDEASEGSLTNRQLRNETIAILLAGHETTANALTWTWHLLGKHPEVATRLRAELKKTLDGRPPTYDELPKLRYTRMVLQESMRLYPPIWIMERRVREADEIGGYRIPSDTSVVLSPYVTHRHPEFWNEAEKFDPDRFTPEASATRPPLAYFPFGAGPRLCIGHHFAMSEAQIILAMVAQRFQLVPIPNAPTVPQPGITLRIRNGLPMTLEELAS
jgi:cytochrome P450